MDSAGAIRDSKGNSKGGGGDLNQFWILRIKVVWGKLLFVIMTVFVHFISGSQICLILANIAASEVSPGRQPTQGIRRCPLRNLCNKASQNFVAKSQNLIMKYNRHRTTSWKLCLNNSILKVFYSLSQNVRGESFDIWDLRRKEEEACDNERGDTGQWSRDQIWARVCDIVTCLSHDRGDTRTMLGLGPVDTWYREAEER